MLRERGVRISAYRRSRRRLCRQADECRRGRADPRKRCRFRCSSAAASATRATIEAWLEKGVTRVIIGTAAVRDPALVKEAARGISRPHRGRPRRPRRQGRGAGLGRDLRALGARYRQAFRGCRRRRHHLHRYRPRRHAQGTQSRRHASRSPTRSAIPVIASGGLGVDRRHRALLEPRAHKLAGAIAGRALYDGRLDAAEALRLIRAARRQW